MLRTSLDLSDDREDRRLFPPRYQVDPERHIFGIRKSLSDANSNASMGSPNIHYRCFLLPWVILKYAVSCWVWSREVAPKSIGAIWIIGKYIKRAFITVIR